jgi:4-amino-4-deoxy-L-arabinose transferase-like glycosyltransferase
MRRSAIAIVLLSAVMCLGGLERASIGDSDEAFYAEAAREMIASGDWLTPTYNFDERFQKPILYYWLAAGTYAVTGVNPTAARWWSAMSALAIALMVFWVTRRWYDASTSAIAGTITATTFGCALMGRMALPDLPLAAFTTATIVFALVGIFDEQRASLPWMLLAASAAALAMLVKGPVGPLVAALAVGGAVAVDYRAARLRLADFVLAAFAFLIIATPWYAVMAERHGMEYLRGFFVGDNLERFATTRFNDPRPVWFYLPIIAVGLSPWAPFTLLWLSDLRRWIARQSSIGAIERRLAMWVLLPLLFFSVSVGKQPRYVLSVLPPLSILLARTVSLRITRAGQARRDDALLRGVAALSASSVIGLGIVLARARPLVEGFNPIPLLMTVSASVVVAGAIALGVAVRGRLARLVPTLAMAACVSMVALAIALTPGGPDPVEQMAALVRNHHPGAGPVGTYRVFVRNLVFYTATKSADLTTEDDLVRFFERPERLLVVITRSDREMFEARTRRTLKPLGSVRYFNSALIKPRTLLLPDAERDVVVVELVSTK